MSFICFLDILSNFHFFTLTRPCPFCDAGASAGITKWTRSSLISPELIDHSDNDRPADQEDSQERQRIPVSAVQKIADSEERGPNHSAAGNPSDQSKRHAVTWLPNF